MRGGTEYQQALHSQILAESGYRIPVLVDLPYHDGSYIGRKPPATEVPQAVAACPELGAPAPWLRNLDVPCRHALAPLGFSKAGRVPKGRGIQQACAGTEPGFHGPAGKRQRCYNKGLTWLDFEILAPGVLGRFKNVKHFI
jgi:hypothetical protein